MSQRCKSKFTVLEISFARIPGEAAASYRFESASLRRHSIIAIKMDEKWSSLFSLEHVTEIYSPMYVRLFLVFFPGVPFSSFSKLFPSSSLSFSLLIALPRPFPQQSRLLSFSPRISQHYSCNVIAVGRDARCTLYE